MKLHQELKQYRENKKLSQIYVAKSLGYDSGQFISNIERGMCRMPLDKCKKYLSLIDYPYDRYKMLLMDEFDRKLNKYLGR